MNNHFKKLRILLTRLTNEPDLDSVIFDAMDQAGTPISKSRMHGWRLSPEHKNYRRMTSDDLLDVLDAVTKYYDCE
jgi:uncharacterized protein YehS (DUF1456 family)